MSTHVLSLLVEDKAGLLTRVAGLFSRRGFNISSLAVGVSEVPGLSRITVVVDVEDATHGSLPMHNIVPRLSATPGVWRRPAPGIGQHTAEILSEFGVSR